MFNVKQSFGNREAPAGDFASEEQAIAFIQEKLQSDRSYNLKATYLLYDGYDLIKEYSQDDLQVTSSDTESGASQKGSSKSFAPTPFNTAPRLGPHSWVRGEDEEEDKSSK